MATEWTLSILKPDALQSGVVGKILTRLEQVLNSEIPAELRKLRQPAEPRAVRSAIG